MEIKSKICGFKTCNNGRLIDRNIIDKFIKYPLDPKIIGDLTHLDRNCKNIKYLRRKK